MYSVLPALRLSRTVPSIVVDAISIAAVFHNGRCRNPTNRAYGYIYEQTSAEPDEGRRWWTS